MAEQAIHEMIAAYAVGCMDKQNFVQFKNYMADNGELPDGELGELQNVVAMIPIILDLEKPHSSIKDLVAKKLIGIKDEIKAKILNDRKTFGSTFTRYQTLAGLPNLAGTKPKASTQFDSDVNAPDVESKNIHPGYAGDSSKDNLGGTFSEMNIFKSAQKKQGANTNIEKTKTSPDETSQAQSKKTIPAGDEQKSIPGWFSILGIIFSVLLFIILGYYTFVTTQRINDRLDNLQSELNSMRSQLATANNFVGSNASLVEFFNYRDIEVISFVSQDENNRGGAKILLSFHEKEGLIQFSNVQQLQPGQSFQLWAVSKGQPYSAGTYQPVAGEYLKISPFPFLPKEQIEFYKITVESTIGATTPSVNIYLVSEQGSANTRRVR